MQFLQVSGRSVAMNDRGFMADFWAWDDDIARGLAAEDGLQLSDCHWTVIRFLREHFGRTLLPPSPQETVRALGRQLAYEGQCGVEALQQLFPKGGCRQACMIAGLPDYYCGTL